MDSKPGTYALVLRSDTSVRVPVGRWGRLDVHPGYYMYVGSAFGPGGLLARVSRHCRKTKAKHWHIDYLREYVCITAVWYSQAQVRIEHRWARALVELVQVEPIMGFGSSDCNCASHLFFASQEPALAKFSSALSGSVRVWSCENVS